MDMPIRKTTQSAIVWACVRRIQIVQVPTPLRRKPARDSDNRQRRPNSCKKNNKYYTTRTGASKTKQKKT